MISHAYLLTCLEHHFLLLSIEIDFHWQRIPLLFLILCSLPSLNSLILPILTRQTRRLRSTLFGYNDLQYLSVSFMDCKPQTYGSLQIVKVEECIEDHLIPIVFRKDWCASLILLIIARAPLSDLELEASADKAYSRYDIIAQHKAK